jgi:hypothetical protein
MAHQPHWVYASSFLNFPDHTQFDTLHLVGLENECSARRRDLYLTTNNTYNRQASMPPGGFEAAITASERRQTHDLDRAVTWIGFGLCI